MPVIWLLHSILRIFIPFSHLWPLFICLFLRQSSPYVALVCLKLIMQTRLVSNSDISTCFYFLNGGVKIVLGKIYGY